jgi:hypothetical protein
LVHALVDAGREAMGAPALWGLPPFKIGTRAGDPLEDIAPRRVGGTGDGHRAVFLGLHIALENQRYRLLNTAVHGQGELGFGRGGHQGHGLAKGLAIGGSDH